jgi:hypothetical protein
MHNFGLRSLCDHFAIIVQTLKNRFAIAEHRPTIAEISMLKRRAIASLPHQSPHNCCTIGAKTLTIAMKSLRNL